MNAAHRSVQLDAVGGMLAVIGGTFMGVGAVQTAGSHQDVWSNPWFDGGCAVVVLGLLLVVSVIVPWDRSWRRRPSALLLHSGSEVWHPFYNVIWGVGISVHIINQTGDPITIVQFDLLNESDVRQHPLLTEKSGQDVNNWIARISSDHRPELFVGEFTVPPHGSVTRWFVSSAYAPRNGSRPHITVQMKDTLNNTYELNVSTRHRHLSLAQRYRRLRRSHDRKRRAALTARVLLNIPVALYDATLPSARLPPADRQARMVSPAGRNSHKLSCFAYTCLFEDADSGVARRPAGRSWRANLNVPVPSSDALLNLGGAPIIGASHDLRLHP